MQISNFRLNRVTMPSSILREEFIKTQPCQICYFDRRRASPVHCISIVLDYGAVSSKVDSKRDCDGIVKHSISLGFILKLQLHDVHDSLM